MNLHLLLRAVALALAGSLPATAQAPQAPQPTPKIVVQAAQSAGVDVAAFTADGRLLITASGFARELVVWDVAGGQLIDRLRLPAASGSSSEFMQLHQMRLSADGRSLRVEGEVLDGKVAGNRSARAYQMDVFSRRITPATPGPLPALAAGNDWQTMLKQRLSALGAIYANDTSLTPAQAEAVLPRLPRTPDGRYQLVRNAPAWALQPVGGGPLISPALTQLLSIEDADLSPDDRRIVLLHTDVRARQDTTLIDVMDISNGRYYPAVRLPGTYDRVRWVGNGDYLALPQDDEDDPLSDAAAGEPPPVVRVSADSGRIVATYPSRCFMVPLPDGSLIGGALGNCRSDAGTDTSLQRLGPNGWVALRGFEMPAGAHIRTIAASPDGQRLFTVTRLEDGDLALEIADPQTGNIIAEALVGGDVQPGIAGFSPDGRKVWLAADTGIAEWTPDQTGADGKAMVRDFDVTMLLPTRFATRGNRLLIGGFTEEQIHVVDLATGKAQTPVAFPGSAALGFMRTRPFIWAASTIEGLRIWDARSGNVVMTTAFLPDQKFVTVAPDGRYDTNLGPDSGSFRWLISDRPLQSLAPQTLMRDFYLPQMFTKLLDCTAAGTCGNVLKPLPALATLNRQLPAVVITNVNAEKPGWADVNVTVAETRDPATGRTSGVYGVKLLINNREIARQLDEPFAAVPRTLEDWRAANVSRPGDDQGNRYWRFTVPLPTDGKPLELSAYSFNDDRVKSDTFRRIWTPPPTTPRPRRAFVLTIGVNEYVEGRLALNFAVPDAQLIAARLAQIPGYTMHHASLTTARLPDGSIRHVTKADVDTALGILAGVPPAAARAKLKARGHDADALDNVTPDDIVILSFSGHGHASAAGDFALLPSDTIWSATAEAPEFGSVIDANTLTMWLRATRAGEIAFIIDACHSGAAVNTPDFKPGPMGDPGLGQLAFDKGIRILAATQANDVALENANLKQGFLTAALGEGLAPEGPPKADLNRDGRVRLDEWLRYAVQRLPSLNAEVRAGGGIEMARGIRVVMTTAAAASPRVQEPSLFDFNSAPSPVVLRGQP
jgi:hypothetical protein